jgi:hypothetical protein
MTALRAYRALIACLAILGLTVNLAAGVLCFVPGNAVSTDSLAFAESWTICSHDGSGVAPPNDGSAPQSPAKPCPLCLTAAKLVLIAAVAATFAVVEVRSRQSFAFVWVADPRDELRRSGLHSRAPPLPA